MSILVFYQSGERFRWQILDQLLVTPDIGNMPVEVKLRMEPFEIIAAGEPCTVFDHWVGLLKRAGTQATQIAIADYDREQGHNPTVHPRGNEVYVLVPAERIDEALKILKADIESLNEENS
jgi:hypothetical protein